MTNPTDKQIETLTARIRAVGGRATSMRLHVLHALEVNERTLTHQEVEDACRGAGLDPDRVTIYRILEWLVDKGIAHKVAGPDRVWRFGSVPSEEHGHAHFHCDDCGQIYCLEDTPTVSAPNLPPGFQLDHLEVALAGQCPGCTKRRQDA